MYTYKNNLMLMVEEVALQNFYYYLLFISKQIICMDFFYINVVKEITINHSISGLLLLSYLVTVITTNTASLILIVYKIVWKLKPSISDKRSMLQNIVFKKMKYNVDKCFQRIVEINKTVYLQ